MRRARARGRRASRQSRRCASAAAVPVAAAVQVPAGTGNCISRAIRGRRRHSGRCRLRLAGVLGAGPGGGNDAAVLVVRARSNPPSVPTTLRFAAYPGGAQDPIAHFGLAPCGAAVSFLAGNLRRCAITVRRVGCLFCAGACHLWQPISGPHILRGGRSFLCRGSSRPLARTAAGRSGTDLSVARGSRSGGACAAPAHPGADAPQGGKAREGVASQP